MKIQNPSKALIALVGLICLTVLMAVNRLDPSAGMPSVTLIIGYAIGNGMGAKTNTPVEPILGKK